MAKVIAMSDLRANINDVFSKLSDKGEPITIMRSKKEVGILVSYEEYRGIVIVSDEASYKEPLANLIANKLLAGAPRHLKRAQVIDFLTLSEEDLKLLLKVHKFPIPSDLKEELKENIGTDIISRLLKRKKIADAISHAEKEGLFETSEHFSVDLNVAKTRAGKVDNV